jgi:hypothetical protein
LQQVNLRHFSWNAYYNAAPIEKNGHFLWIPVQKSDGETCLPHFPQVLTFEFLEDAIYLFKKLDQSIVFFNGLHAGASVNHIHLQAVHHHQPLALATTPLKPMGNAAPVLAGLPGPWSGVSPESSPPAEIFSLGCISCSNTAFPYNLVMIRDSLKTGPGSHRVVLFPRDIDHEITSELPNDRPGAPSLLGQADYHQPPDVLRPRPAQAHPRLSENGAIAGMLC